MITLLAQLRKIADDAERRAKVTYSAEASTKAELTDLAVYLHWLAGEADKACTMAASLVDDQTEAKFKPAKCVVKLADYRREIPASA